MANANNQNVDTGLRHRKSSKNTEDNGNYELQQGNPAGLGNTLLTNPAGLGNTLLTNPAGLGNMHNPNQQMMGWMPHYPHPQPPYHYGMGGMGWMPAPGMQPYPPQQPPYPQPPYPQPPHPQPPHYYGMGGMGWMPAPGMQQPMILPPLQPVFNDRAFAPSHNGNIQDFVHINELKEESKDANPIKDATNASAATADAESDYGEDVVYIPKPNAKKTKEKVSAQEAVKIQDNLLADLFDNVLDDNMQRENHQKVHNTEFGQESDESNVIIGLTHIDKHQQQQQQQQKQHQHHNPQPDPQPHFDNVRFPNEIYNATMVNGDVAKLPAKDISSDALETAKIVYEHNNQLAASGQPLAEGKAFIYVRSSRTNDISIETQRKACLQYASVLRLELLSFGYQSDNNISARNMGNLKHELGFWKDYIPDGSHIIIYSVDRLSRNLVMGMQFLDEMAARGIHIHFTTHELVFHNGISAAGRAMIQQELQSAEKFSNIASEKIRTTMARLRQEGHVFGRAPYGYKHTVIGNIRKRTPDNKEQQNIRQIQSQYSYIMNNWENNPDTAELRYSKITVLRTLVRWCNRNGMKHRNQKNYTISQLKNIIQIEVDNN